MQPLDEARARTDLGPAPHDVDAWDRLVRTRADGERGDQQCDDERAAGDETPHAFPPTNHLRGAHGEER